jgi:hypothetical protein
MYPNLTPSPRWCFGVSDVRIADVKKLTRCAFSVANPMLCSKIDRRKSMGTDVTQEREQAHALLDMLPVEKLIAVRSLLEVMVETLSRSLDSAPAEEEEIAPETAAAIDCARASLARGEGIPHEDIRREFGRVAG